MNTSNIYDWSRKQCLQMAAKSNKNNIHYYSLILTGLLHDHNTPMYCCFNFQDNDQNLLNIYSTYTERRSASETDIELALLSFYSL